jgi:hypothetical protein
VCLILDGTVDDILDRVELSVVVCLRHGRLLVVHFALKRRGEDQVRKREG